MSTECNIGYSQDSSFELLIKRRTKANGVDFVLYTLSNNKQLQASLRCLGRAGVFLNIENYQMPINTKVNGQLFRSVGSEHLFLQDMDEMRIIHDMIERDLQLGIIQPLRSTVFQLNELKEAYQFLINDEIIEKALVQVRKDAMDMFTVPLSCSPRADFDPNKVYIILGGLGGFGLELTDWMVLRGAQNIVISSRRGLSTSYQAYRIEYEIIIT